MFLGFKVIKYEKRKENRRVSLSLSNNTTLVTSVKEKNDGNQH